jgi:eukaryotic-like serine/threonine-protein kinase
MSPEPAHIFDPVRFGDDFELDVRSYELRRDGQALKLERIPMELLVLLVERRGELVTRDQIAERIWGKDVFLDTDNSINAAIRKIRQVLKDDPERPRFVVTVTGKGYRFVAPLQAVEIPLPESAVPLASPTTESLLGKKVSHYRIVELLGGGGMGVVYKAEDLKLGRQVALKLLPGELASDPTAFERLQREARAASLLDHPNICSVYHLGEHDGQPFIAMQLLEGETLREWISKAASLDATSRLKQLREFAIQILDGLQAAHEKGIIHRDIKPANIFITTRGQAKILDFGVAKFIDSAEFSEKENSSGRSEHETGAHKRSTLLTLSGASVGTPSYLSPEQIRHEKLDARSDLFSFGLVLYEMATGERAFSGTTATQIRDAVLKLPPASLRQLRPDLPPELGTIVAKSLEKDRESRYQSARDLRSDLIRLRENAGTAASWLRHITWTAAAAVVIAAILLATNFRGIRERLMRRGSNEPAVAAYKARPSLAVLGFKNLSGRDEEAWISSALSEMLAAEMGAGQQLRVIASEDVARMKVDLSLPAADSYSRQTLTKIRNQLNSDIVVLGSYLATGKDAGAKIRIDLQLQDARDGETIAVVSRDGIESDLAELVSQSGANLRQKLGVTEVSATAARQVRAAVPANGDAARFYAEGLAKLQDYDALAARALLEKAIATDPRHALSHFALAEAWSVLGYEGKAAQEAKQAQNLSTDLPREQRLSIEGRYKELAHDLPGAIEIYRTLRNFFPDDLGYALQLANAQTDATAGAEALQTIALMRKLPEPMNRDPRIDLAEAEAADALSDFRRTEQAARAAEAKARALDSPHLLARAKVMEGWALLHLGDLDQTFTVYSEARELWTKAGNLGGAANALHGMAMVQRDRGDFLASRKSFEEAITQLRTIGAMGSLGSCVHNFGVLLNYQGNLQEAKQQFEEALRIQRETNNDRGVASDLDDLSNVLMDMGDLRGAARMKEQALDAFHRLKNRYGESITLVNLGEVALAQGLLPSAKDRYERAMTLAAEVGDQRGQGYCILGLGRILFAQDRLSEARNKIAESISLRRQNGDEATVAESQIELAKVALEQGQNQEAESLARMAGETLDKRKAVSDGAEAYAVLSLALLAEGKSAEAQTVADRALALSRQSPDVMARFEATLAAQVVRAKSGKLEAAAKTFDAIRVESGRDGFAEYEFEARLGLAELDLQSGRIAVGRTRLQQLEEDARKKGFLLVARKARSAARNSPG